MAMFKRRRTMERNAVSQSLCSPEDGVRDRKRCVEGDGDSRPAPASLPGSTAQKIGNKSRTERGRLFCCSARQPSSAFTPRVFCLLMCNKSETVAMKHVQLLCGTVRVNLRQFPSTSAYQSSGREGGLKYRNHIPSGTSPTFPARDHRPRRGLRSRPTSVSLTWNKMQH